MFAMKRAASQFTTVQLLLALYCTPVCPQATTAAVFLLQPLGARGVALGEGFVAVADGAQSLYWNPAGLLGHEKNLQFVFTHRPVLFADFENYEHATIAYQFSPHLAVAGEFRYVSFGRLDIQQADVYAYAVSGSVAYKIAKGLSAGLTARRISQYIGELSAHSLAIDFGLLYRLENVLNTRVSNGRLNLGASLANIGQDAEFFEGQGDPLPRFLRVGLAYEAAFRGTWSETGWRTFAMLLSFEYQNLLIEDREGNIWEWGAGLELRLLEIIAVRLGYHERHPKTDQTLTGETLQTGMSYGFGIAAPLHKLFDWRRKVWLKFDLASAPQNGFVRDYQMYTFGLDFELP